MKKIISIFAGMILSVGMIHATDIITVSPVTVAQGDCADVVVVLNSDTEYKGFQFDLTTPDDVDAVTVDGHITAQAGDLVPSFSVSSNNLESGVSRFVVLSFEGTKFSGNGSLLKVTCQVDKDLAPGEYKGVISGIKLATADFKTVKVDDIEFKVTVVESVPDAINSLTGDASTGDIYNIQGQKTGRPVKGFNIVNGVKVLVK